MIFEIATENKIPTFHCEINSITISFLFDHVADNNDERFSYDYNKYSFSCLSLA